MTETDADRAMERTARILAEAVPEALATLEELAAHATDPKIRREAAKTLAKYRLAESRRSKRP